MRSFAPIALRHFVSIRAWAHAKPIQQIVPTTTWTAEPKRKLHKVDNRDERERQRMHQERALDEALENTFPASDQFSVEQPKPSTADRVSTCRRIGDPATLMIVS